MADVSGQAPSEARRIPAAAAAVHFKTSPTAGLSPGSSLHSNPTKGGLCPGPAVFSFSFFETFGTSWSRWPDAPEPTATQGEVRERSLRRGPPGASGIRRYKFF